MTITQLARVGFSLSDGALAAMGTIFLLIILFHTWVQWRCAFCGRENTTRLLVFMLQWCDHGADDA